MKPPYYPLPTLVDMIEEPNRAICKQILAEHETLFKTVQGSSHNHQAWVGGYYDHVQDVMNIGIALHTFLSSLRPIPCTISDVLLVLFLHDIEKPWKYEMHNGALRIKPELVDKKAQRAFRDDTLRTYGISLTPEQENAMLYVEGEHTAYTPGQRTMHPLAALCHLADVTSARIWFDHPSVDDVWGGARKII